MNAPVWWCGVLVVAGSALALSVFGRDADAGASASAAEPPAQAAVQAPRARSVFGKGVIESIRELPADVHTGVRRFETTLRMRDGSAHVSNGTGDSQLRIGDAIRLFGTAPAALQ